MRSLFRYSNVPWITAFLCCLNGQAGVDHGQYLKWASAAVSGDIAKLANDIDLNAPTGLPFSPWSAGPGLLVAPLYFVLGFLQLEAGAGLITGYICVFCFWISLFRSLKLVAGESWAVIGCLLAAVGTPAGYYCSSISSETFGLAIASYLTLQAINAWKRQPVSIIGTAAATSLLLMVRSYLGVYAWPALVCGFVRARRKVWFAVASAAAMSTAFVQIGIVNFWMTGSWQQNAYSFGDEYFQSFDGAAPFFCNVLFDPFHGLIPSHPLVAVGIFCGLILLVDSLIHRRKLEAAVWFISTTAILVNLYVQSCWFYWWLAMSSFGMRGLVLASIPAILAIVRLGFRMQLALRWQSRRSVCLQNQDVGTGRFSSSLRKWQIVFGVAVVTTTAWGWIHLSCGVTNCVTLGDLGIEFLKSVVEWGQPIALICLGLSFFILRQTDFSDLKDGRWLHQWRGLLLLLFLAFSIREWIESPLQLVFVFYLTLICGWAYRLSNRRRKTWEYATKVLAPAALLVTLIFFGKLGIETTKKLAQIDAAEKNAKQRYVDESPTPVFNWPDARRAYLTLNQISRFHDQAVAIRGFLQRRYSDEFVARELDALQNERAPGLTVTRGQSFFVARVGNRSDWRSKKKHEQQD